MIPRMLNQLKIKLYILFILFSVTGLISEEILVQTSKKKTLPVKEKKIIETVKEKEVTPNKTEDDTRDADDDDKSDKTDKSESSDITLHENPYYKVVIKTGVVLRDKPKVTGKKILIIPEDTIGEILEETKEREVIETQIGRAHV